MKQTKEEIVEELDHQRELRKTLRNRIRALERKQAQKGIDTPPETITELASLRKELDRKELEIDRLEKLAAEEQPSLADSIEVEESILAAFLFLEVRARDSGQFVKLLSQAYVEIREAAAVYSETDVIVRIAASKSRLGEILFELLQEATHIHDHEFNRDVPFEITSVKTFLVDGDMKLGKSEQDADLYKDIYAYIIIEVEDGQDLKDKVLKELLNHEGVIYTAALTTRGGIIAKVKAPNKITFDNTIMAEIQEIPRVMTTLSLIVINSMHITQ